jgi:hypothetical protein
MTTPTQLDAAAGADLKAALEALSSAARRFFLAYLGAAPPESAAGLATLHSRGVATGVAISLDGTVDVVAIDQAGQVRVIDQPRLLHAQRPTH